MADHSKQKTSRLQMLRDVATPDQLFCVGFSVLLIAYFPAVFKNCIDYTDKRKLERPDYPIQSVEDFYFIPLYALIIRICKMLVTMLTKSYFRSKLGPKYSGDILKMKITKCCRGVFKVGHFSFMFIFGWRMVLLGTTYCPPLMLGDGDHMYIMSDWPFTAMPKYMKFYYVYSLSYYVEDLIAHIFQAPNSDYFEMILHHLVTIMLIVLSYFNSFWNFGIFVLMQMDLADVFIGLIRSFMDFVPILVNFVTYLGIMYSFVHFRIIANWYIVLYSFCLRGRVIIDDFSHTVTFITILLLCLLGLNIYWFVLLLRMGYRLAFKGKSHDLQNVVTNKDIQS